MSQRRVQGDMSAVVPGGILESDDWHIGEDETSCSRCGLEPRELEEALELLAARNLAAELEGIEGDTYPRACMLHLGGRVYGLFQDAADVEPNIAEVPDDPTGHVEPWQLVPVSQWSPP